MVKTHCKRGHEFTEENTWVNNQGARVCRECNALRTAKYRQRNPAEKKGHRNIHKTHCPKGHEYSDENTYVYKNKRHCKLCAKVTADNSRLKRYSLSVEQYAELLESQENKCRICSQEFDRSPHIDHDHTCCSGAYSCGKCVRGLLCYNCNAGIGQFSDNLDLLKNAVKYLESFTKTTTE
jgi:hypothetical protein